MVPIAFDRNQRRDLDGVTGRDVLLAEVTRIRQESVWLVQSCGIGLHLLHHRLDLLLVVGGLGDMRDEDQHRFGIDHRLGVVALLETAAGHLHDPRLFVGQVDLIIRARAGLGRLRWLAARLLAGRRFLLCARNHLGGVFCLLRFVAFLRPRLVEGQTFDNIEDIFEERKAIIMRGDFEYPQYAFIDEMISTVLVQLFVSMNELKENGTFMGNCTHSMYKSIYKQGSGVLYRLTDAEGNVYNSDFRPTGARNAWVLRETKGRRNQIVTKQAVKDANAEILRRLNRGI